MTGIDWLPTRLPDGWRVARVVDHVQLVNGYPFDSAFFTADQGLPLVRIRDLGGSTTEVCFAGDPVPEAEINHGDVLIGMDGDFNVARWAGERALLNQRMCRLKPQSSLEPAFLAFLLPTPLKLINELTGSTTVKHLSSFDILKIRFPLPPLSMQTRLGSFLESVTGQIDKLVAAKQRVLDLLAEKRKAIIATAVTRGLDPKVKLRHSGVPWLGVIPAHWKAERVRWYFRERDQRGSPELPLMEVSISRGVAVREFSDDRIEATAADFNSYKIAKKDDIAFNKMRMWQGAVGVAPTDGLVSPDYVVAEPTSSVLPAFAGLLFRIDEFSAECGRRSHGLTWDRLRIYWEEFREIEIPIPPLPEQAATVAHVAFEAAKLDAVWAATERTIGLLKERRSALIAAAVTGQIDLGAAA